MSLVHKVAVLVSVLGWLRPGLCTWLAEDYWNNRFGGEPGWQSYSADDRTQGMFSDHDRIHENYNTAEDDYEWMRCWGCKCENGYTILTNCGSTSLTLTWLSFSNISADTLTYSGTTEIKLIHCHKFREFLNATFDHMTSLQRLTVQESPLVEFPNIEATDMRVLNFIDNQLHITTDTYREQVLPSSITHFALTKNNIHWLPAGMLSHTNVRILSLGWNHFKQFPEKAVAGVKELVYFGMEGNQLETITFGNMKALADSKLQHLNISNNHIFFIERYAFSQLKHLKVLEAHQNNMATIPFETIYNIPELLYIDLNHNLLEVVNNKAFVDLPKLITLRLHSQRTPMKVINYLAFSNIGKSLKNLWVSDNALETFPHQVLAEDNYPKLMYIWANDNRIRDPAEFGSESFDSLRYPYYQMKKSEYEAFSTTPSLVFLNLENNNIGKLRNTDFCQASVLAELYLTNNHLTEDTIPPDAFACLTNLKYLSLAHNNIQYVPEAVISSENLPSIRALYLNHNHLTFLLKGQFSDLKSIYYLNFDGNRIVSIENGTFPDSIEELHITDNDFRFLHEGPFTGLAQLEELHLDHNAITIIPDTALHGCTNLQTLAMNNNRIGRLMKVHFQDCPLEGSIHFHKNEITYIESKTFAHITSCEEILLGNNDLTTLSNQGGNFHSFSALNLKFDNNRITSLPSGVFKYLSVSDTVDLSGNKISHVETAAFVEVTFDNLYLTDNPLTSVWSGAFTSCRIKSLIMKDLWITDLQPRAFLDHWSEVIELQGNRLVTLQPETFCRVTVVENLDLSSCNMVNLGQPMFCPNSSVANLLMNDNKLFMMPSKLFDGVTISHLNADDNELIVFPGAALANQDLTSLFLARNKIFEFPVGSFVTGQSAMTDLGLGYNKITAIPSGLLDPLINLQRLYLDGNEIAWIGEDAFSHQTIMEELYLQVNQLRHFPALPEMPQLQILVLNSNQLETFGYESFLNFNMQKMKSLKVHLWENQLECDCNLYAIASHLKENLIGMQCSNPENTEAFTFDIKEQFHWHYFQNRLLKDLYARYFQCSADALNASDPGPHQLQVEFSVPSRLYPGGMLLATPDSEDQTVATENTTNASTTEATIQWSTTVSLGNDTLDDSRNDTVGNYSFTGNTAAPEEDMWTSYLVCTGSNLSQLQANFSVEPGEKMVVTFNKDDGVVPGIRYACYARLEVKQFVSGHSPMAFVSTRTVAEPVKPSRGSVDIGGNCGVTSMCLPMTLYDFSWEHPDFNDRSTDVFSRPSFMASPYGAWLTISDTPLKHSFSQFFHEVPGTNYVFYRNLTLNLLSWVNEAENITEVNQTLDITTEPFTIVTAAMEITTLSSTTETSIATDPTSPLSVTMGAAVEVTTNANLTLDVSNETDPWDTTFRFWEPDFFPLDDMGYKHEGQKDCLGVLHNFGFTSAIRAGMPFTGNGTIAIGGGDEMWVYLNGVLLLEVITDPNNGLVPCKRIDISPAGLPGGGLLTPYGGTVSVYGECNTTTPLPGEQIHLELIIGDTYHFDVFQVERYRCKSKYFLETTDMYFVQYWNQDPAMDYFVTIPENVTIDSIAAEFSLADLFSTGPIYDMMILKGNEAGHFDIKENTSFNRVVAVPPPPPVYNYTTVPGINISFVECPNPREVISEPYITINETFTIPSASVLLTVKTELDYEVEKRYVIVMSIMDIGAVTNQEGHVVVRVSLSDINDNCPVLDHTNFTRHPVPSLQVAPIMTFSALDNDTGINAEIMYYGALPIVSPSVQRYDASYDLYDMVYNDTSNVIVKLVAIDKGEPPRGVVGTASITLSNSCLLDALLEEIHLEVYVDVHTGNVTLRIPKYWVYNYECLRIAGMQKGYVQNWQVSASSSQLYADPGRARINETYDPLGLLTGGWVAGNHDNQQWLQVDMLVPYKFRQLITQGRQDQPMWVKNYRISYSDNKLNWTQYINVYGNITFPANNDQWTEVTLDFEPPVLARYIRIHPQEWEGGVSMRIELVGCEQSEQYYYDTSCQRCQASWYCIGDGLRRPCGRCNTPTEGTTCGRTPSEHSFGAADKCATCPLGWICHDGYAAPCPKYHYAVCNETHCPKTCSPCEIGYACRGGQRYMCMPGEVSNGKREFCEPCLPGTFQNESAQGGCYSCSHGYHSSAMKPACLPCPKNTWSHTDGMSCLGCGKGQCRCLLDPYPCDPNVQCINLAPDGVSFTCQDCPPGYHGDGIDCTDVNECLDFPGLCWNGRCINTRPGYQCLACPWGYTGTYEDGLGYEVINRVYDFRNRQYSAVQVQVCSDIDECVSGQAKCVPNSQCINTMGSYQCGFCDEGYIGSQLYGCVIDDYCVTQAHDCHPEGTCDYVGPGKFRCKCADGFAGDGRMCGPDPDLDGHVTDSLHCITFGCVRDNCPYVTNSGQEDNDGDTVGDFCDPDDDEDGIIDEKDNCQYVVNYYQVDGDSDGIGDACDNCPAVASSNQMDSDRDGQGDACDTHDDNDGCRTERLGRNYEGYVAQTKSGKTCQRWLKQFPHGHSLDNPDYFPDPTLEDASNFCRNPDNEPVPWCYTTDPATRWDFCDVPYCECKDTKLGKNYMGKVAVTKSGKSCQQWNAQSPHEHSQSVADFQEGELADAANYCRNPDSEPEGPWCFTTDPESRWEFCDVPMCECRWTMDGASYSGQQDRTSSGLACQRWDSQEPHQHGYIYDSLFPDATVSAAENFCRNPDAQDYGPWCYTTDPEKLWEYCDIRSCGTPLEPAPIRIKMRCKTDEAGRNYEGYINQTKSGKTCQRWTMQVPHAHSRNDPDYFPDATLEDASNFCRNPDNEPVPWCYTTDPATRWDYCDVPYCAEVDGSDDCPTVTDGDSCGINVDRDGDGVVDKEDNCGGTPNADQSDIDQDGAGDACDNDMDGDYVVNDVDNCPFLSNPGQEDGNNNGIGDACKDDSDGDGIEDETDPCPKNPSMRHLNFTDYTYVDLNPSISSSKDLEWEIKHDGSEVRQLKTSEKPGLLIGSQAFGDVDFSGTWYVLSDSGDGYIGFVFGYQYNRKFYLVQWKKSNWNYGGTAYRAGIKGIQLKLVNSGGTGPGGNLAKALWHSADSSSLVTVLWHEPNMTSWEYRTAYRWHLSWQPSRGLIRLRVVHANSTIVESGDIFDSTITGGRLGVFVFDQSVVHWSDLTAWCHNWTNLALKFDGVDDYVELTFIQTLGLQKSLNLEAWVRLPDTYTSGRLPVICTWHAMLCLAVEDRLLVGHIGKFKITGENKLPVNVWNHLTMKYEVEGGQVLTLFVNGTAKGAEKTETDVRPYEWDLSSPDEEDKLYIGHDSTNWFQGEIDEVRIYNRWLPSNLIASHLAESGMVWARHKHYLVTHFDMDDDSSSTILRDNSVYHHDGVMHGNPKFVLSTAMNAKFELGHPNN